jgi:hypothetical protein
LRGFAVAAALASAGTAFAEEGGSGATLGDFEGKSVGIGPVVSYAGKVASHDVVAEFKWLHETDTEKRLQGDILWLKVVFKLY